MCVCVWMFNAEGRADSIRQRTTDGHQATRAVPTLPRVRGITRTGRGGGKPGAAPVLKDPPPVSLSLSLSLSELLPFL